MSEFDTKRIKEGKTAKEDKGKRNRRGKSKGRAVGKGHWEVIGDRLYETQIGSHLECRKSTLPVSKLNPSSKFSN